MTVEWTSDVSDSRQPEKPLQKAEIVDFYERASPDLQRFLTRKLGNGEEAEEVAHDAFEKLLRRTDRESIKDLRRFFFTMANRMALDVLRRREVQGRFLREQPADGGQDVRSLDDPARMLINRERLAAVQAGTGSPARENPARIPAAPFRGIYLCGNRPAGRAVAEVGGVPHEPCTDGDLNGCRIARWRIAP